MNRRDFAKSLAALGAAPALSSLPVAATASTASTGFSPYLYGLGAHLARSQGECSAALLVQKLRLAPEAAQAMQAQLLRQGIVTAPNAAGLAAAAQPYMRGTSAMTGAMGAAGDQAKRAARSWVKSQVEATQDAPAEQRDNEA